MAPSARVRHHRPRPTRDREEHAIDTVPDLRPLPLDDDHLLARAYAVECAATSQVRPGWTPLGEAARVAAWRSAPGWDHALLGAFDADVLLGFACGSTAHDTPDTCWVNAVVHPEHQRRGVGSSLVRAAEAGAGARVRRYVASLYRPTTAQVDELVRTFAHPLGYAVATTETVVELELGPVDPPAPPLPDGYIVETHVDGVPDALRADVGVLKGLVDAEAPHGDLDWQPTPVPEQEYLDEVALWRRQGRTVVESVALDPDGRVAAWTCLVVAADPARPAQVEGTLVLARHRGRGLGRAVKIASQRAAREAGALRVRTSSDDENLWMRAINDGLGFVAVESEAVLQRERTAPPA